MLRTGTAGTKGGTSHTSSSGSGSFPAPAAINGILTFRIYGSRREVLLLPVLWASNQVEEGRRREVATQGPRRLRPSLLGRGKAMTSGELHVHIRAILVSWDPVAKRVVQRKLWRRTMLLQGDFTLLELCKALDRLTDQVARGRSKAQGPGPPPITGTEGSKE